MRTLFTAAAALLACSGTASAGLFFIDITMNNPSNDPWSSVEFKIVPVEGVEYGPGGFGEQVQFSTDVADFATTKPFTSLDLVSEFEVRYDFAAFAPFGIGDTETFTLGVMIEEFVPFKIQQYFTPVPTPGAGALAGVALLMGFAARRRRSIA